MKKSIYIVVVLLVGVCAQAQTHKMNLRGTAIGFDDCLLSLIVNDSTKRIEIKDNKIDIVAYIDKSPQKLYLYCEEVGYYPFYAEDTIMHVETYKENFRNNTKISGSITHDIYTMFQQANADEEQNVKLFNKYLNTDPGYERLNYLAKDLPIDIVKDLYNKVNRENLAKVKRVEAVINTCHINEMKVGAKAYPFAAIDQFGDSISFHTNKYILLSFSQTYCPASWGIYEQLNRVQMKYGSNLKVINFHIDNNKNKWNEIAKSDQVVLNYSSLWEIEKKQELLEIYDVFGWPLYYLIDRDGIVVAKWFGNGKLELKRYLRKHVK